MDPLDPTRFDQLAAMGARPEDIAALKAMSQQQRPMATPTGAGPTGAAPPAQSNPWQDMLNQGSSVGDVQSRMLSQNQSQLGQMQADPQYTRLLGSLGIYPPAGTPLPSGATAGGGPSLSMPSTYPVSTGLTGQFGFQPGQGVNVMDIFRQLGVTPPQFVQDLSQGRPSRPTNLGMATQQLGGLSLPSPQMLGGLNPSGLQFLASIFEALLGIPFNDILSASMQPFQGLGQGRQGRTQYLGFG